MRPSILHPLGDRRYQRRQRRPARIGRGGRAEGHGAGHRQAESIVVDPAVARAREAGGPVDHASYNCGCGYLFVAAVSTTVLCPHCGTGQAW